jgi:hypothetical protein
MTWAELVDRLKSLQWWAEGGDMNRQVRSDGYTVREIGRLYSDLTRVEGRPTEPTEKEGG